jgi:DnaJ-class molecular chaperone
MIYRDAKTAYLNFLGLHHTATDDDIKKAHKQKQKDLHPDRPGGSEEQFKKLGELKDLYEKSKNQESAFKMNVNSNTDFQDIFRGFGFGNFNQGFTRNAHTVTIRTIRANITLEEAFSGTVVGDFVIPPGVKNGQTFSKNTSENHVKECIINISPHHLYTLERNNLHRPLYIDTVDCILGIDLNIETICGKKLKVNVPAGSTEKSILLCKSYGMNQSGRRGDLLLHVRPVMPNYTELSDTEKDLYKRLRDEASKRK